MTTRRVFLQTLAAVGAASACGACGGPAGGMSISGDVSGGNASALSVGSLRAVPGEAVAIGRDARGVYAMSLICTHQGCDMSVDGQVNASGAYCSCHGSRFDRNGARVSGPARGSLTHYEVSADAAGNLTIHGANEVSPDTRLTV